MPIGRCGKRAVSADFDAASNPAVSMEWTDANGVVYTGQTMTPAGVTDTTGGALPGGIVRWRNVGSFEGQWFDLLVTVAASPAVYGPLVSVAYIRPEATNTRQALTFGAYACLGVGVQTSSCESGSALDPATADCADGTPTTMHGSEFDMRFVLSGSSDAMPVFERFYISFFDVDGDSVNGFSVFELQAVLGAASLTTAPTSTLEAGEFSLNGALYAISTQNVNVQTDFAADPTEPSQVSLPAIASFELRDKSAFQVLLGGRSSAHDRLGQYRLVLVSVVYHKNTYLIAYCLLSTVEPHYG